MFDWMLSFIKSKPAPVPITLTTDNPTVIGIADAIIHQEGGADPKSVNAYLVRNYNLWDIGHLTYAGQALAKPVVVGVGVIQPEEVEGYVKSKHMVWAGWPDRESSELGVRKDVIAKIRKGMTLSELITMYAPPTENDTAAYIKNVAKATGLPVDKPVYKYV